MSIAAHCILGLKTQQSSKMISNLVNFHVNHKNKDIFFKNVDSNWKMCAILMSCCVKNMPVQFVVSNYSEY